MKIKLSFFLVLLLYINVAEAGHYTVVVKDTDGNLLQGIRIDVGYFEKSNPSITTKAGLTDKNGEFDFRAFLYFDFTLEALKEGYYLHSKKYAGTIAVDGVATPAEEMTVEVVLKNVRNPISMYVGMITREDFPVLGKKIGYDLAIGDWVHPHGKGVIPHMYICMEGSNTSSSGYRYRSSVTFPNKGDGLALFNRPETRGYYIGSKLMSDHEAPESGYIQEMEWFDSIYDSESRDLTLNNEIVECREYSPTVAYYIRVNTILDNKGNVISANYGKIYGDLYGRIKPDNTGYITWGGHYLNPTPNDRNVEFDPTCPLPDSLLDEKRRMRKIFEKMGWPSNEVLKVDWFP